MNENEFKSEDYITIKHAAEFLKTTRSNLYNASNRKRLTMTLIPMEWVKKNYSELEWEKVRREFGLRSKIYVININDLGEYYKSRWDRKFSKFEGKDLFEPGEYSPMMASRYLNVPLTRIYYLIYTKYLPTTRKNASWIINEKDLKNLKEGNLHG